jgi:hypothetical protein
VQVRGHADDQRFERAEAVAAPADVGLRVVHRHREVLHAEARFGEAVDDLHVGVGVEVGAALVEVGADGGAVDDVERLDPLAAVALFLDARRGRDEQVLEPHADPLLPVHGVGLRAVQLRG